MICCLQHKGGLKTTTINMICLSLFLFVRIEYSVKSRYNNNDCLSLVKKGVNIIVNVTFLNKVKEDHNKILTILSRVLANIDVSPEYKNIKSMLSTCKQII